MPRRRRLRKIVAPPVFSGYKPYGTNCEADGAIEILYEEYEALKLADYKHMNHKDASELMGVSRPTFARIYKSARIKIAKALVEAKEIRMVYGNAWMDKNWYICNDCHSRFTIPKTIERKNCPVCASENKELLKDQNR